MNRFSLQFAAVAIALGTLGLLTALPGQGRAAAGRGTQPAGPMKIAVVDMSYLFEHYEKLEDLRESVKAAADAAQAKAQGLIEQARSLDEQLKSGEYENGSAEFIERENKVIQLSSRFEAFKKATAKDLKKKDAAVLLEVYEDVRQAVEVFAQQNGFTLVLQVNRDTSSSDDKTKVGQKLGQPVFRNQNAQDITDGVLAYLSQEYAAASASGAPPNSKNKEPASSKAVPTPARSAAAPAPRSKAPRK